MERYSIQSPIAHNQQPCTSSNYRFCKYSQRTELPLLSESSSNVARSAMRESTQLRCVPSNEPSTVSSVSVRLRKLCRAISSRQESRPCAVPVAARPSTSSGKTSKVLPTFLGYADLFWRISQRKHPVSQVVRIDAHGSLDDVDYMLWLGGRLWPFRVQTLSRYRE